MDEIVEPSHVNKEYVSDQKPIAEVPENKPEQRNSRVIVLFCIFVIAVVGTMYWRFYENSIQITPNRTSVPQTIGVPVTNKSTVLRIATDEATKSSSMVTVPIVIDTGENTVSVVELHISLSPVQKQTFTLTPGTFFTNPTILNSKIDQLTGTAVLIIGSSSPRKGTGTVGVISLSKPLTQASDTQIDFAEKTRVAAINEKESVLKEVLSGHISY